MWEKTIFFFIWTFHANMDNTFKHDLLISSILKRNRSKNLIEWKKIAPNTLNWTQKSRNNYSIICDKYFNKLKTQWIWVSFIVFDKFRRFCFFLYYQLHSKSNPCWFIQESKSFKIRRSTMRTYENIKYHRQQKTGVKIQLKWEKNVVFRIFFFFC